MRQFAAAEAQSSDLVRAFDASPNPYMLLTPDLRYAGMNQAYLDVVGRTRQDLLGRELFERFTGGDDDGPSRQLRASIERVIRTARPDHLASIHYPIEMVGPNGEVRFSDRYWSATHTPVLDAQGRVTYVLQHTTDITELHTLREQAAVISASPATASTALDVLLSGGILKRAADIEAQARTLENERNRLVEVFMQAPGFVAVLTGPDHVFQMHNAAYGRIVGRDDVVGLSIRDALPELAGQGYFELLDHVRETGEPYHATAAAIVIQPDPSGPRSDMMLDFVYQPIRGEAGEVAGIFVQGHDVTDAVKASQRQRLMIDELNHRVKNTLATVQSIAMQTARSHIDPQTFAQTFQARLVALSHTHNLLTRSHWEGADLSQILAHETQAHGPRRVLTNGPAVALTPPMALSLGMVFHEMATNAAKYGALSTGEGRVTVDWSVVDQADRRLKITWLETGGPPARAPEHRGFGSRLIERNVRHDLAGNVEVGYPDGGLRVDIDIPLDRKS